MRTIVTMLAALLLVPLILFLIVHTFYSDYQNRGSGKASEAEAFLPQALQAVERYRQTYARWPVKRREKGTNVTSTIYILRGVDHTHNALEIDFMEDFEKPIWNTRYDPWGQAYMMRLDLKGQRSVLVGTNLVPERCVFWSIGPNGIDQFGEGDDLASWKQPGEANVPALQETPSP